MSLPVESYDLVVLGCGPAGEKGAAQAAYFGKRVAVVDRWPEPGGVTVHTGTMPSKTLREAALYLTGFRRRELYGMTLKLDRRRSLRQLAGRLRDVTDRQVRQIRRNLERHRITTVSGSARFVGERTVAVLDGEGRETRRLRGEVVLVAVGSSPLPPTGLGFDDPDVEDSDRILDLDRIPSRLVVVGGGVIGCEYASIFAALGTRVTLIEGRERLLGFLDGELSAALRVALERMGAHVLLGDAVESLSREPDRKANALRLSLRSGAVLSADKVLFSVGRRGNVDGLGLDVAGVAVDARGRIAVDADFLTTAAGVYAAGDVIGFPALAATSMEQGRVAMRRAFGIGFADPVASVFPYGIYTVPEISTIGLTEEEAREKGIPYEVGRARYENNARGQITGDVEGFVKLLFDPESKRILGAHLLGGNATELVHVPATVMALGGTLETFLHAVFNVPTLSECFKYAAYDGLQRLSHRSGGAPLDVPVPSRGRMAPGARAWFVGVDLTDPHARDPRPVTVAFMDRWRRVHFQQWRFDLSGAGLLPPSVSAEGYVLAVDGPQGLAAPGGRMREAERLLCAPGKSPERMPRPGSGPYAGFVAGSVALFAALRSAGASLLGEAPHESTDLLEVYPGDLWPKWAGYRLPKKTLLAGRRARHDLLRGLGLELPVGADAVTHDQLDAAAAAYAAYLWATGKAVQVGHPPVFDASAGVLREGYIVTV